MRINTKFDIENLAKIEAVLLAHPIAQDYFRGVLFDGDGEPVSRLTLHRGDGTLFTLNAAAIGKLFMIPDDSIVSTFLVKEHNGAPGGFDVRSSSLFLAEDEQNSVIVFSDEVGPAMWIDGLYIARIMLASHAPSRLATVAFGFMAITAYRLGFLNINLFAAGHGPLQADDAEAFVGYAVWPKFGFNAPVLPVELNRFPHPALKHAISVQDILLAAPDWWAQHGSGRFMSFDLTAGSRSWSILLHYLYETLSEDVP